MMEKEFIVEISILSNDADIRKDRLAKNQTHTQNIHVNAENSGQARKLALEKCQKILLDIPDEKGKTKFKYRIVNTKRREPIMPGQKRNIKDNRDVGRGIQKRRNRPVIDRKDKSKPED